MGDITGNDRRFNRADLARYSGDLGVVGGVRLVELADGVERGIRCLEFRTGTGLAFEVLVDRAMDIGAVEHAGRAVGWRSATGFRHPGLHEHADDNGLSWVRSFSGLLVTAGLDHTLFPAEVDGSHYNYLPTVWQPLHGRISNIPARLTGYGEQWTDEGCVLWAEGEVRQARVFGEHLVLRRRIEADLGGNEIRLVDTVTNAGSDDTPHMQLYHVNVGWPVLDEGSRFVAAVDGTRWCTASVVDQGISYRTMPAPARGVAEQVYEHELATDTDGTRCVALLNDRLGLGFEMTWRADEFPCFFEWLHLREGAYAIGLEPSTHHVEGEEAARADGSMTWLGAGESRSYHTTFAVLDGADALSASEARIRAVGGQPDDTTMAQRAAEVKA
ncbi:MAG TPA: aldose 1-epimerase family protein [Acidimicrobiales bacterium]|nr:aldose 1-epimerase family protein [Acidimicrobiales bacterium]